VKPPLPTAFELAQLAGSARFANVSVPEAIGESLELWMYAVLERAALQKASNYSELQLALEKLRNEKFSRNSQFYEALSIARAHIENSENRRLTIGTSHRDSEAMEWLKENAGNKLERFQNFGHFRRAFDKWIDRSSQSDQVTVADLKAFLKARQANRRKEDTKRKRVARSGGKAKTRQK
jgi:hypothetical protein